MLDDDYYPSLGFANRILHQEGWKFLSQPNLDISNEKSHQIFPLFLCLLSLDVVTNPARRTQSATSVVLAFWIYNSSNHFQYLFYLIYISLLLILLNFLDLNISF